MSRPGYLFLICCLFLAWGIPKGSTVNVERTTITIDDVTITIEPDSEVETQNATFTVRAPTDGWVGLAFSRNALMPNSDFIVSSVAGASVVVTDRHASARVEPSLDAIQNVLIVSATEANGFTTAVFQRDAVTGDGDDISFVDADFLLWAYGTDDQAALPPHSFSQHGRQGAVRWEKLGGLQTVDLGTDLREVHGSLMFVAFGYLVVLGYLQPLASKRTIGAMWIVVHLALLLLGVVLAIAGFGVIVAHVSDVEGDHFSDAHHILGLIVIILVLLQVLLGTAAHVLRDPERETPLIFPNMVHMGLARLIMVLSVVTVFLGIDEYYGNRDDEHTLFIIAGLWAFYVFVTVMVAEVIYMFVVKRAKDDDAEGVQFEIANPILFAVLGIVFFACFLGYLN